MTKKTKEKLVNEVNKYSTDDEVVGIYTKLSHQEIIKNGLISSAKEEGMAIGEQKAKIELAKNLLNLGDSTQKISKVTGLSEKEILDLKE